MLALDALRVLAKSGIDPYRNAIESMLAGATAHAGAIDATVATAARWFHEYAGERESLEAGARGFALTLARTYAAALLARRVARTNDALASAALARFLDHGLSRVSARPVGKGDALLG